MKFRKKPVVVEAVQFKNDDLLTLIQIEELAGKILPVNYEENTPKNSYRNIRG